MPKRIQFEGKTHEFPDDFTDADIQSALNTGAPQPSTAKTAAPNALLTLAEGAAQVPGIATDALKGVGSGVISTGVGLYDLARKIPGAASVLPEVSPEVRKMTEAPDSNAGRLGKMVEQGAEFLIPGSTVAKGAKLLAKAPAAVRVLGRAAMEGASAAAVTGAQTGGDTDAMKTAALTGAAVAGGTGIIAESVPSIAKRLKAAALKQYEGVLNPTMKGTKYLAKTEVAPELVKRGVVAGSLTGLQTKVAQRAAKLGQQIGDAFDNLPADTKVDAGAIINKLETSAIDDLAITNAKGGVLTMGPYAEKASQNLKGMADTIMAAAEHDPATGKYLVPVDKVRKLRQYFDKVAAKGGRYEGKELADQSMMEAHGMAADAIRQEMGQQFPSIAAMNKEFSFWKNAQKVVDETAMRRTGQAKPLRRIAAQASGAAVGATVGGPAGALLGGVAADQLQALMISPAWGTVGAVAKDRLASMLATGNRVKAEAFVRKMTTAYAVPQLAAPDRRTSSTQTPAVASQ